VSAAPRTPGRHGPADLATRSPGDEAGPVAPPFLFVVGCGRSGTTLLRAMLDAHPRVAVPPESYFVVPMLREAHRYGPPGALRTEALLADLGRFASFGEWGLDPGVLSARWSAHPPRSVGDALTDAYRAYAANRGKDRWADKTPFHVLQMGLIAEAIPAARFVHLVRDPRDVAPSVVRAPFGPNRLPDAALYWRRHAGRGRELAAALGPDRVLTVRYEDLVADPQPVLTRICAFLDVDYHPAMLAYHERADELLAGLRVAGHLGGIREPLRRDGPRWPAAPRGEVLTVELLTGDLIEAFGYPRSGLRPRPAERLAAAAHRSRWWARLRWRRLRARARRARDRRRLGVGALREERGER
jgi:hypothetical protein